jgi:hypothetical protein
LNSKKKQKKGAGLPDFSSYKMPKWEKCIKLPQTIPNANKI